MSILHALSSLALRGAAEAAGVAGVGAAADGALSALRQRFGEHSQRLTRALKRANAHAWRALEISLAGQSWWQRTKVRLSSGDDKAFRDQVHAFLAVHPWTGRPEYGPDYRATALRQLQAARKAGLLEDALDPARLADEAGHFARFADPAACLDAEWQAVAEVGSALREAGYPAVADLLSWRPPTGTPLLVAAVRYFFGREVEADRELFQGLAYRRIEDISTEQRAGFASLGEALDRHGDRLEELLDDVRSVVVETHADVLDLKSEMQRQSAQMRELSQAVLEALQQRQLDRRSLRGDDSLSIRDEGERALLGKLVARFRALPAEKRRELPALLNAVGKLQVVAGDFESAQHDFQELGGMVADPRARAEAHANAYRAALERRDWPIALSELTQAVTLAPQRFEPFPFAKFQPERILGAGGFGVAFLCTNRHSGSRVVIKTLGGCLGRDLGEVFREARALEEVEHPAVIRVRDCDYADPEKARPYLVMDYFPGQTLAEHVEQHGPMRHEDLLPLARLISEGLRAAHSRAILHRDVKPANVLVRRTDKGWEAKLIDFGLAVQAEALVRTASRTGDRTLAGRSIAGTLDYAAPEQMGKLPGALPSPSSDVYCFARTCCFALFRTPHPTFQHWQKLPPALADLLGRCLLESPAERPASFDAVLQGLARLPVARTAAKPAPIMATVVEDVDELEVIEPARPARPAPRRAPQRSVVPAPQPYSRSAYVPPTRRGIPLWPAILLAIALPVGAAYFIMTKLSRPWPQFPNLRPGSGAPRPATPLSADEVAALGPKLKTIKGAELVALAQRLSVTRPADVLTGNAFDQPPTPVPGTATDSKAIQRANVARAATTVVLALAPKAPFNSVLTLACFEGRRIVDAQLKKDISGALAPLLASANYFDRVEAAKALEHWADSNAVPAMCDALQRADNQSDVRQPLIAALSNVRDPRGIVAIATRMTDSWDTSQSGVVEALISFGPAAEDEVVSYLEKGKGDHVALPVACTVLEKIGTAKSVEPLRKLSRVVDPFTKEKVDAALAAIEKRNQK